MYPECLYLAILCRYNPLVCFRFLWLYFLCWVNQQFYHGAAEYSVSQKVYILQVKFALHISNFFPLFPTAKLIGKQHTPLPPLKNLCPLVSSSLANNSSWYKMLYIAGHRVPCKAVCIKAFSSSLKVGDLRV